MKKLAVLLLAVTLSGCAAIKSNPPHPGTTDPLANNAYDVIVGAKGYLESEKSQHPECATTPNTSTCSLIRQAIGGKDLLIDALSVYCSGPNFLNGGVCDPPAKGTPAYAQAAVKLQAAISNYNTIAADLKKVTGGD